MKLMLTTIVIYAICIVGCSAEGLEHKDNAMKKEFLRALGTTGRSPEIPEAADAYGWLVGSWDLDVRYYAGVNLAGKNIKGEAHFGWVLEGRAIQDVWIMPRISERTGEIDKSMNMYGTTLRVWDSSIRAWRITWTNPAGSHHEQQIGGWDGEDIVQTGTRSDGTQTRWRFTEIKSDSFHWLGEAKRPGSNAWELEGEFLSRRVN